MTHPSTMESTLRRAEAINAVRELQHRFGYLLDAGNWDDAAALFTEDASLQVGRHHPRHGRRALRTHLREVYSEDLGIPASLHLRTNSVIRANLQIMPVVTVAPDALTARATWRHLGCGGGPALPAYWTEGPQEVEYRCSDGSWLITSLRWFRTLAVPYEGGWAHHADLTAPVPEAPDEVLGGSFQPWPRTHRTPFHFLDPALPESGDEGPWSRGTPEARVDDAGSTGPLQPGAGLPRRVRAIEIARALENLQGMLGYYVDKGQWSQGAALFTEHARVTVDSVGIAQGQDQILALLHSIGPEGAVPGRLLDFIHIQPVITPGAQESTAHGRWKVLAQMALSGDAHEWGLGELQVNYADTTHGWRIAELDLRGFSFTDYDRGWSQDLRSRSRVIPSFQSPGQGSPPRMPVATTTDGDASTVDPAPDEFGSNDEATNGESLAGPMDAPAHAELTERLERVVTAQSVERLQYIYGYCLAEFLWDELTGLFTSDGSIEIALRGVYRGRKSIRRSLELYGSAPQDGILHNHMQFQPVIHLDPDGRHASIRCRALSMMGRFGGAASWMGGVYENRLVYRDGTWLMHRDRVVNTYFAPYEVGWKDLPLRSAPGTSTQIPPDEPPSGHFDMYPGSHLVPFHYPDPHEDAVAGLGYRLPLSRR